GDSGSGPLPGAPRRAFGPGGDQLGEDTADAAPDARALARGRLPQDRRQGDGRRMNGILTIASRDVTKLLRDTPRLVFSFVFPLIFIGLMGGTLQGNLGRAAGFNFIGFIFTGVLGMTLFQSSAQGVISLIQDREEDF